MEKGKMKKITNYMICGLFTTGIDWIIYFILRQFKVNYMVANLIAWTFAVIFAYVSNKLYVFQEKEHYTKELKTICLEFSKFFTGRIGTGILQISGIYLLVSIFHYNEYLSKLLISILVLILNYIISKYLVFQKTKITIFYFFAFFIPIVLMILLFFIKEIYPFGDEFFVKSDGFHQYIPFLKEFARRIQTGESLFYSFNLNLGTNFLTLYAYYLASPFNWFCIFVPIKYITEFAGYLMIFKVGLSSLTFYTYIRKKNKTRTKSTNVFYLILSFCYAMSGYWAAYNWNIMWLDCIVFLPLVLLGIYKLITEKKIKLYLFSLFFCILSNYYISIMICLFSCIYFIYELILQTKSFQWKEILKKIGLFTYTSIIAGGLCSFLIIPELYGLTMSASENITFPEMFHSYFPLLDLIPRHFMNLNLSMTGDFPNLYSGLLIFFLIPIYFLSKEISLKEKICSLFLLIFLYIGFSFNILDFIWHGFHFPNSLPCRQSFIYIAILLLFSSRSLSSLIYLTKENLFKIFLIVVGIFLYFEKFINEEVYDFKVIWTCLAFIFVYFLLFLAFIQFKKQRTYISILLTIVCCGELCTNLLVTSLNTWNRTDYLKDDKIIENLLEDTNDNYRIEKRMSDYRTKNDGSWYDYPSISTFSSSSNKKPSDFYKLMGLESSWNASNFRGATPFMSSLLNIKYELSSSKENDNTVGKLKEKEKNMYLYENLYTFPLGFEVSQDIEFFTSYPADNQNKLSNVFIGKDILIPVSDSFQEKSYSPKIEKDGRYYLYVSNQDIEEVEFNKNENISYFENVNKGYFLDLGYLTTKDNVKFMDKNKVEHMNCVLYYFDNTRLQEIYEHINGLTITKKTDTFISGQINMLQNDYLCFSIPYDKGWSVFVDGKEVQIIELFNTFIGVKLEKGTHTIEMKYIPQGFHLGIIISIIVLSFHILLCLYIQIRKKMIK